MAIVRPNQKDLTQNDWSKFINAINAMHGIGAKSPAYRDFVKLHVDAMSPTGMSWKVHTMKMMGMIMHGTNFLAWHRQFLISFEKSLGMPIPYWDWISDPNIPSALNDNALLTQWGVTREWDSSQMPIADEVLNATKSKKFSSFQTKLERGAHADVHVAVGGTMNSASSPADPIFFLHHANIDRIWFNWQKSNSDIPKNKDDTLKPGPPIQGVLISSILDTSSLNYSYSQ